MDIGQSILMNNFVFSTETLKVFIEKWPVDRDRRRHWKLFSKNRPGCKSMFLFFFSLRNSTQRELKLTPCRSDRIYSYS